eukprot:652924-Pyramimonas_sp.AAC.1
MIRLACYDCGLLDGAISDVCHLVNWRSLHAQGPAAFDVVDLQVVAKLLQHCRHLGNLGQHQPGAFGGASLTFLLYRRKPSAAREGTPRHLRE